MVRNFIDDLAGYRVKVEREGKEVVNIPGILALPGLLVAPKMSLVGMIAAPLLGCSVRVENAKKEAEAAKRAEAEKKAQDAADAILDMAKKTVRTIEKEFSKAWESVSADDPEGCPEGKENEDDSTKA
ncbi:MAG: DUF4342 domain-containing protein [Clostridia bacterium]|nr:DUF4342 domain-containing protein [Clostridia bacterium]